jgi:hypothetical protein
MRPDSRREKSTLAGVFDNLVTGMGLVVEGGEGAPHNAPAKDCASWRVAAAMRGAKDAAR